VLDLPEPFGPTMAEKDCASSSPSSGVHQPRGRTLWKGPISCRPA
jgi:hypothetical protein